MMDKYLVFHKNSHLDLNEFFNTKELECHCPFSDCQEQRINKELMDKLYTIRKKLGAPIYITSGFRCKKKQNMLRKSGLNTAKGLSQHELGNAIDVQTSLKYMPKLLELLEEEFQAIGIAKTFYHIDTRSDKKRRWAY